MSDSDPAAVAPERYELFEAGWQYISCPLSQLWAQYLGLGGNKDLMTIEAFMFGLMPLSPNDQDILATAINEMLEDLFEAVKVPYLNDLDIGPAAVDPLAVLDKMLRALEGPGPTPPE